MGLSEKITEKDKKQEFICKKHENFSCQVAIDYTDLQDFWGFAVGNALPGLRRCSVQKCFLSMCSSLAATWPALVAQLLAF